MSLNALLTVAEGEAHHVVVELPIPPLAFGAIAMAGFLALLVVTMSFRNVAHRHAHKLSDVAAEEHHGH